MSRDDFRRLIDAGDAGGVALEVDDATWAEPLVVTTMSAHGAATVRLSLDGGRQLFDALTEALGLVTAAAGVRAAAGADTPTLAQG